MKIDFFPKYFFISNCFKIFLTEVLAIMFKYDNGCTYITPVSASLIKRVLPKNEYIIQ